MKKIIIVFLLLLTSGISYAIIDTSRISIQEAVVIATKNNLDIQSSRLNVKIDENKIDAANRLQNPEFDVDFAVGQTNEGEPQKIGFDQVIEIGKRGPRKDLAKASYELTERYVEYLEFDLRMDVREAYTNLLAKKSVRTTIQEQEELLQRMLEKTKEMYEMKQVKETDVLQAQLLLNQLITEVQSANYEVKTALYQFNKVINCPDGFYDTKEDSFTKDYKPLLIPKANTKMPDFETISNAALNNRYDIKIALQQIEVAEKSLLVELRKKVPDIEIEAGYNYISRNNSNNHSFQSGAYVGGNIINLPLFYRFEPEIKNAKLKLEQAHLNYASVENKALNDLRKTYEKFLLSQSMLRSYSEKLLDNSEELIQASRKSYINGDTDLTTLITMEESYRMIRVAFTYALADYYNAWNAFIREVNNEQFTIQEQDIQENV